jgi:hypothetical protein
MRRGFFFSLAVRTRLAHRDEVRRIAANIAKIPRYRRGGASSLAVGARSGRAFPIKTKELA